MSNLKKTMSIIVATVALLAGGNAQAQIPVTDAAAISTSIANHVEDIAKYVEQIAQLKAQLDQAKQLDTVDLANDPKAAADLQNRIAAEQTMLQNEQAKLAMLYQLHQTQQQQLKQQQRELAAKTGRGTPVHVTGY